MVNIVELVTVNPCLLQTLLATHGDVFDTGLYRFLDPSTVSQSFTFCRITHCQDTAIPAVFGHQLVSP